MGRKNNPGCCGCGGGPTTLTFTVSDCKGNPRNGISVTITQGATVLAGITSGAGSVTYSGLSPGSYSALIAAPNSRWTNRTITGTLVSGANINSGRPNVATGFVCDDACVDPLPTTLHIVTTYASGSLIWQATPQRWEGNLYQTSPYVDCSVGIGPQRMDFLFHFRYRNSNLTTANGPGLSLIAWSVPGTQATVCPAFMHTMTGAFQQLCTSGEGVTYDIQLTE